MINLTHSNLLKEIFYVCACNPLKILVILFREQKETISNLTIKIQLKILILQKHLIGKKRLKITLIRQAFGIQH